MAETTSRLEFLLREYGFAEPEITQDADYPVLILVSCHRSDLDVEESLIRSYAGEEYVTASVACPCPVTGSVKRTDVAASTAHTGFQTGS